MKKRTFWLVIAFLAGSLIVGGWFVLLDGDNLNTSKSEVLNLEILETDVIDRYPSSATITIDGIELNVEVVETADEMVRGLSGRTGLAEDEGMLFVYDEPGLYSFWMKDMKFPIDIIWIDENFEIIDITKNVRPDSFPQTFQPQKLAQYVLEVKVGFSDKNNIEIGESVDLSAILLSKNDEVIVIVLTNYSIRNKI